MSGGGGGDLVVEESTTGNVFVLVEQNVGTENRKVRSPRERSSFESLAYFGSYSKMADFDY